MQAKTTNKMLVWDVQKNNLKSKIKWTKRASLWIPFIVFTLIMVIVPLIFVFLITLIPTNTTSLGDGWEILNGTIWIKIFKSLGIALASTLICIVIAYPFSYFLSQTSSKPFKKIVFLIATMPMWLGSLIILVALKSLFDKINGALNSTYGDIYTIIGIVYLYIPYAIIPLYNSLETLPRNLVEASRDLGQNAFMTFIKVVLPHSKDALISAITLVLLPSMSVVAVPQFLNNAPDGSLIGDIIMGQGIQASESAIALLRVCVLSVVVSILMFIVYMCVISAPKFYVRFKKFQSARNGRVKNE